MFTLSVIKTDVGGFVGHSAIYGELLEEAKDSLGVAQKKRLIVDFHVTACGDGLELIMTHHKGIDNKEIHQLTWEIF